jgi:hypothetical protein
MTHGIKSLAQDLAKHGRYGDTMVAHINPQEAAMLKAMGGSGTINPVTGLPEFGGVGSIVKGATNLVKSVVQPVYNATIKNIPGVDQALVGLDKTVGKAIPGGWGTVASMAGAAAGVPMPYLVGLGALNGSGALRKDGKFNLQGALMGGAMAYGMSSLGEAVRAADIGAYDPSAGLTSAGESANAAGNSFSYTPSGEMVPSDVAPNITGANISDNAFNAAQSNIDPSALEGMSRADVASANVLPQTPNTAPSWMDARAADLSSTGRGLANLSGLAGGEGTAAAARAAFTGSGASLTNTALPIAVGGMGLMDIQAQEDALNQQQAAGTVSQEDYSNQMARINDAKARATTAMNENPYKFAQGGNVQMNPPDDQTGMPSQTPMTNFDQSGIMSMIGNTAPQQMYAAGGMASGRFLSGGGDGLSDGIPAIIGDKQPAKLADGEFVVSSDVVSGLGGGSSKAGAKKLYAMMDRVRKQAHGTKKQIRPVSTKALPA